MSFKFKIGDLVLSKAAIVQQAVHGTTISKVLIVTGLITVERASGTWLTYEVSAEECSQVEEHEIVGIDGYNPDFTTEQVLGFINGKV